MIKSAFFGTYLSVFSVSTMAQSQSKSKLSKTLAQIPQRIKDLVMGQLKRYERKHKSNLPQTLKYLCLFFYNENSDKFVASSNSNANIKITPKKVTGRDTDVLNEDNCIVYMENEVEDGINTWQFQLTYSDDAHETSSKGIVSLETKSSNGDKQQKYSVGIQLNTRNLIWIGQGEINLDHISIMPLTEEECRVKSNDNIALKFDANTGDIYYKINKQEFIKVVDGTETKTSIPKGKYRIKLTVYGGKKIEYELKSYQKEV